MFLIDFDFVLLNIALLVVCYISGTNISRGGKYWGNAIWCLLAFTFVMGSRYGRGPDYFSYIHIYERHEQLYNQYGFRLLNDFLAWAGVGKFQIFYYYAMISMLGGLIFLKRYRQYGVYIYPLFVIATWWNYQNPVRQGLSFTFVFLYILQLFQFKLSSWKDLFKYHNHKRILLAFLFLFLTAIFHTANLYIGLIFTFVYFLFRFPIPVIISWPLVIFFTYIMPSLYSFEMIAPLFEVMEGQTELTDVWISRGENYFSEDSFRDEYVISKVAETLRLLSYMSFLYFGYKVIKMKSMSQDCIAIFNFSFMGMLILSAFRLVELLSRVGFFMYVFWFFPMSIILYYRRDVVKSTFEKVLFVFSFFMFYEYFGYLFMSKGGTLFLWDANN